jgi:hypothetical protein
MEAPSGYVRRCCEPFLLGRCSYRGTFGDAGRCCTPYPPEALIADPPSLGVQCGAHTPV